ncbi:DUF3597 domain-containing protein [Pseudorhodoplanes sp.]|uniref:DUF3597 domain-containing protein n=1 Tax=Pseudorhodoplanes sp. TaxID=1934341 RepID=UPI002C4559F6|nr:DUF3597 domain-containing protein [Pseudorhodoplanes sp.]HWV52370.1 DUF3597 domain-containing protein [Pseudorhodoplanes sp.]
MSIFGKILSAIGLGSGSAAATGSAAVPAGGSAGGAGMSQVDVDKVVTDLASKKTEKLDWKKSIVDLMKVLDLDSSLKNRQELAKELGYTGDMNDSAKMNIWLHKQVMVKLAENGGKVPESLKA